MVKQKKSISNLILLIAITSMLLTLPTTFAQDIPRKKTYPYIGLTPNPVGVGQEVLLHVGITDYTEIATHGWEGLTVTVTDPQGNEETLGPFTTDSTGGTGGVYVPTMIGTYTFQTHFPEQTYTWSPGSTRGPVAGGGPTIYEASDSSIEELIVTAEPREYYSGAPLPTNYWSRPINAQHREWDVISGNWLTTSTNRYAPYNDGPESPHILWSKPIATGGLIGGEFGVHAYECGDAYRGKFQSSVIINGVLYYNRFPAGFYGSLGVQEGIVAVDLHTGEELWFRNNTVLSFGQVMYWDDINHHSGFAYLWNAGSGFFADTSKWDAYDPFTGEWVYTMENVPSGSRIYGSNGEILIYTVNLANGWMTMWNSTNIPALYGAPAPPPAPGFSFYYHSWLPEGKVVDATDGIQWNVTIPTDLPGSVNYYFEDRIIGTSIGSTTYETWGISLESGQEGELLFRETWDLPGGNITWRTTTGSLEEGVFTLRAKETRQFYGFSTETGMKIWGPTESRPYMDAFMGGPSGESGIIADGNLYLGTMAGVLYCHDAKTGAFKWKYEAVDHYSEILWSNNWPIEFGFVTDGKVYLFHTEHSSVDPKPRGAPSICLNAETGEELWRVDGAFRATTWGGDPIIGDSIIVTMSTYDQQIYAIGKGPSAITAVATPEVSTHGSTVMIKGSVTDVSPGTKEYALDARFPNGVPAIADADMGEWMKYVYMQFPMPMVTGVSVKFEAVDPNGNYQSLGTTTSDSSGNYAFAFEPEVPGQYMIIATFEGSESYYSSCTTTYLYVDPAPSPAIPIQPEETEVPTVPEESEAPTEPEQPVTETPLISTEVAIVAAVAVAVVIGVAAFWALRRRG